MSQFRAFGPTNYRVLVLPIVRPGWLIGPTNYPCSDSASYIGNGSATDQGDGTCIDNATDQGDGSGQGDGRDSATASATGSNMCCNNDNSSGKGLMLLSGNGDGGVTVCCTDKTHKYIAHT